MDRTDAAQGVHQLVLIYGRERARELLPEKQRPLVDIAAEVLGDEQQRIGISYTGFCLTSLPHKRLPDDQAWEKRGHHVTLMIEPGRMKSRGRTVLYGVSGLPSFSYRTEHLDENRLCYEHFSEPFDQGL